MPEKDIVAETQALLEQTEALIEAAQAKYRETSKVLEELGLSRETGRQFIDGPKGPTEEKAKAKAELAAFQREIDQELAQAVANAPKASSGGAAPASMRARMVRI